jgi:hypothetical protein
MLVYSMYLKKRNLILVIYSYYNKIEILSHKTSIQNCDHINYITCTASTIYTLVYFGKRLLSMHN